MRKVTIDTARGLFTERGCILLSREIKNVREKLTFICSCGRVGNTAYDKFRSGQLCGGCRWERGSAKQSHTIDFVRAAFIEGGCELLSTHYTGNKQHLEYRCECGNAAVITFAKFQAGQRCWECRGEKIAEKLTGSNNPNWRTDLSTDDRVRERTIPGYNEWRRAVFERDDFACVCCGTGGTLNAHHLESYARVPEKRIDVDNGVTLCRECHKEYHRKIEHNDATIDGFIYFMNDYREPQFTEVAECY